MLRRLPPALLLTAALLAPAAAQLPPMPTPHPAEGCASPQCFTHAQTMFIRQLKLDQSVGQTTESLARYEMTPPQREITTELARQLVVLYLALRAP